MKLYNIDKVIVKLQLTFNECVLHNMCQLLPGWLTMLRMYQDKDFNLAN